MPYPFACPLCGKSTIFTTRWVTIATIKVFLHFFIRHHGDTDETTPEDFAQAIEDEFGENWKEAVL